MNIYNGLAPEEKIEQYLKQRQKEKKKRRLIPLFIYLFFFIIAIFASCNVFNTINVWFVTIVPLLFVAGFYSRSTLSDKKASFLYEQEYHEPLHIYTKEEIKQNHSSSSDLRIINTICTGKNHKGELLFGKERNKVLFPIKPYKTQMNFYIEENIRKNDLCFVVCINSFENPVAVFKGQYTKNKYLTYNE